MKRALSPRFQNEDKWLYLHMPYMRPAVDGVVAIDGGSKDKSAKVVKGLGGVVAKRAFDWDFGAQANALLGLARQEGYDTLLCCDPDECVDVNDIERLRGVLETFDNVQMWLLHFIETRGQVSTAWVNDRQIRMYRLHPDTHYQGRLHERLVTPGRVAYTDYRVYHYGVLEDLETRSLQWANYDRLAAGLPVYAKYDELPEAARLKEYPPSEVYRGRQPLDPEVIGWRAPLEE